MKEFAYKDETLSVTDSEWVWLEKQDQKAVQCEGCLKHVPNIANRYYKLVEENKAMKHYCVACANKKLGLPDEFKIQYYSELINAPDESIEWVVPEWIPAKGLTILGGKRSSFKTWVALNLALSVSSGKSWLGQYPTNKHPVLYINQENPTPIITTRLKQIPIKSDDESLAFISFSGFNFNDPKWPDWLSDFVLSNGVGLVIVDPFAGSHDLDENEAGEMRLLLTNVSGRLVNKHNCAFVLIHHLRKGIQGGKGASDPMDEFRGSSEFVNYADSIVMLDRPRNARGEFVIHHLKCRHAQEHVAEKYLVEFEENGAPNFVYSGPFESIVDLAEKCLDAIVLWAEEGERRFKAKAAIEEMEPKDFSRRTTNRALKLGVEKQWLKKVGRGEYCLFKENEPALQKLLHVVPSATCATGTTGTTAQAQADERESGIAPATSGACPDSTLSSELEIEHIHEPLCHCATCATTRRAGTNSGTNFRYSELTHFLQNSEGAKTTTEIATALNKPEAEVLEVLDKLAHEGEVKDTGHGWIARTPVSAVPEDEADE